MLSKFGRIEKKQQNNILPVLLSAAKVCRSFNFFFDWGNKSYENIE